MIFSKSNYHRYREPVILAISFSFWCGEATSIGNDQFLIRLYSLQNSQSRSIGVVEMTANDTGWNYRITMNEADQLLLPRVTLEPVE